MSTSAATANAIAVVDRSSAITPPLWELKSGTWVRVPVNSGLAAIARPANICLRMLLVACTGSTPPLELLHELPKKPSVNRLTRFCAPQVTLLTVEPIPAPPVFFSPEPELEGVSCVPPCPPSAARAIDIICAGAATDVTSTATAAPTRIAWRSRPPRRWTEP